MLCACLIFIFATRLFGTLAALLHRVTAKGKRKKPAKNIVFLNNVIKEVKKPEVKHVIKAKVCFGANAALNLWNVSNKN